MRICAMVLAAWLAATTPLVAQSSTASPEARAAAKELVEVMQAVDQFRRVMPIIMQQLKPAISQGRPEVARDFDLVMPAVMEAMSAKFGELAESFAALYAFNFSTGELQQLTAFYRTPLGRKFIEKVPEITQQSFVIGQKFGERIAGDLRQAMIEQLRKRGHNI